MANISAGNRLYLYRLLSQGLGVGKQSRLTLVDEALSSDGLCPEDLGCADARELCEQLGEFIKLTVFKKNYVYATVLANEEYDRALERLAGGSGEKNSGKASSKGKPWKHRGGKALKPVKPRHVERVAPAEEGAEAAEAASAEVVPDEPAAENEPQVGDTAADTPDETPAEARAAEPEPADEPATEATPIPEPAPEPQPAAEPAISLTITYDPDADAPEPAPEPASFSPAPDASEPAHAPARVQSDLPQDFHADVRCSSEQLSILYQVLPADVDPLATLEEDFRVARSTGSLEGTRSNVSFPLRFLRADGAGAVRVTLRRSARAVAGKRWALTEVDAGEPEEVGLEGLSEAPRGPWAAFLEGAHDAAPDPERTLTQTVALGSWDEALDQLAELAALEDWGTGRHVLRDYLTMTFARVRATGALAVSADGGRADFDTGLLTADGRPVYAHLAALAGDIPWQLAGFSTSGSAEPAHYVSELAQMTLDPGLPAPALAAAGAVARNPRLATTAYDPVNDRVLLLVPDGDDALALLATPKGYEAVATMALPDAYACARVVSAEQPAWLVGHIDG